MTSITASPIGRGVIMSVDTFKTDFIVFMGDVIMCLMSDLLICELRTDLIFLCIKVRSVIQTLSVAHIKGKMSKDKVQ